MSDDWTTDAVDNIERVVATVRDRTVRPAQNVTRAIVFGLLTAFFVLTALTIVSIGLFRLVDVYVPAAVTACRNTWSATSPAANTPSTEVAVDPALGSTT